MDQTDFTQGTSSPQGPQFELTETGGWGSRLREWLGQYGSSVILPLVALAILASGIYLYATQKRQQAGILLEDNNSAIGVAPAKNEETETNAAIVSVDNSQKNQELVKQQEQQIVNIIAEAKSDEPTAVEILPAKNKNSGNVIAVRAEKGEGVTHLARKALKNYLQNNQPSSNLTKEHKIYIEDYIKDKIGSRALEVNEEMEISKDLINEAINSSAALTAQQLQNIEQFSAVVAEI